MLSPILNPDCVETSRVVLVVPDTACYRRLCRVHVLPNDRFLEVGCDLGRCTAGVVESLALSIPQEHMDLSPSLQHTDSEQSLLARASAAALGVDRAEESVLEAQRRFPHARFEVCEALSDSGAADLRGLCRARLGGSPSFVAIDINGNRPLDAVLRAVGHTLCPGLAEDEKWHLPRLVVVKSKELYDALTLARSSKLLVNQIQPTASDVDRDHAGSATGGRAQAEPIMEAHTSTI